MSAVIVNPLLDSMIQQLTVVRTVLGESAAGVMIEAAKAQLTATKLMLGGEYAPGLPSPRGRMREEESPQMQLDVRAPKTAKKPRKKKYKSRALSAEYKKQPTYNPSDLKAAILLVLREAAKPMLARDILQTVEERKHEFGLRGRMPNAGVRDPLATMINEGSVGRKGSNRDVRFYPVSQ